LFSPTHETLHCNHSSLPRFSPRFSNIGDLVRCSRVSAIVRRRFISFHSQIASYRIISFESLHFTSLRRKRIYRKEFHDKIASLLAVTVLFLLIPLYLPFVRRKRVYLKEFHGFTSALCEVGSLCLQNVNSVTQLSNDGTQIHFCQMSKKFLSLEIISINVFRLPRMYRMYSSHFKWNSNWGVI